MTAEVKTRLSNSILIGDIFGMLFFGLCIDRFGRRIGIILTTLFLVFVSQDILVLDSFQPSNRKN
jgi:MFS family permease